MRIHHYLLLAVIIAVAGLIRYQYNTVTSIDTPVRGDATYYVAYANNLIQYQTFSRARGTDDRVPDSFWAPGYPVFLAGNILFAELIQIDSYKLTLLLQALLGTLTVVFVFMLARIAMPASWALFATGLMALSPHAVSLGSYLLTETLFSFLLTLALLFLAMALRGSRKLLMTCAGFTFAAAYMVNPVSLFVAPIALLGFLIMRKKDNSAVTPACSPGFILLLLGPLFLTAIAWSVRSSLNVPENSGSAEGRLLGNLIIGMYSDFYDVWRANPRDPNNPATLAANKIGGSYALFFQELVGRFKDEPGAMLRWYLIEKPLLLWDWDIRIGQGDIYVFPVFYSLYHLSKPALASYSVMHAAHGWLLLLGLGALLCVWRDRGAGRWLVGMLLAAALYSSVVYVITQAEPRYSIPLRPLLYICAAYSLWIVFSALAAQRMARRDAGNVNRPGFSGGRKT